MKSPYLVAIFLALSLLNGCSSDEDKNSQTEAEITPQAEKPVIVSESNKPALSSSENRDAAKSSIDEANRQINIVWNGSAKKFRKVLLPEQREWLKKRKSECDIKATADAPTDVILQDTIRFNCMAEMTIARTKEIETEVMSFDSPATAKEAIVDGKKQINTGLFYLTENEEHYMPQMIKAAQLVVKDPACLEITFGGVGIAGQYVDIPNKTGVLFYITCKVSDLPSWEYDNFWVSPDELTNSKAIYRQHGIK